MKSKSLVGFFIVFLLMLSCKDEPVIPKPKAKMRLEYPQGKLADLETENFSFKYNQLAEAEPNGDQAYTISYPEMKGAIFLSYKVQGNAASQSQFFVTDSTEHFLTGSVYFYSRPNYDSILPAASYLQNDIRSIIETLRWKNK